MVRLSIHRTNLDSTSVRLACHAARNKQTFRSTWEAFCTTKLADSFDWFLMEASIDRRIILQIHCCYCTVRHFTLDFINISYYYARTEGTRLKRLIRSMSKFCSNCQVIGTVFIHQMGAPTLSCKTRLSSVYLDLSYSCIAQTAAPLMDPGTEAKTLGGGI